LMIASTALTRRPSCAERIPRCARCIVVGPSVAGRIGV
jgi:hypothetical protein